MTYALLALQEAVHAKLTSSTPLGALLGSPMRVFDHPPPSTAYPFVQYGDQAARAFDTADATGLEIFFTLQIYSRGRGRRELRQIEAALYNELHNQPLTISGAAFGQCQLVQSEQRLESDGLTYRGTLRFRFTLMSN